MNIRICVPIILILILSLIGCSTENPAKLSKTETSLSVVKTTIATELQKNETETIVIKTQPQTPIPIEEETKTPLTFTLPIQPLSELFLTNGNCKSPCLWGIIPGITNLEQINNWATAKDLVLTNTTPGHYSFGYVKEGLPRISVILEVEEDIIIGLNAMIYGIIDPMVDRNEFIAFSPESIMQKYGIPSQIILDTEKPHEPNSPHDMVMYNYTFFYDDQKLIVQYIGGPIEGERNGYYTLCPGKDKLDSIRLWLGSYQKGIPNRAYFPELEAAASITIGEFYQKLIDEPLSYCVPLKAIVFKD